MNEKEVQSIERESEEKEKPDAFLGLVRDGLLELSEAAKRLEMSKEELRRLLENGK